MKKILLTGFVLMVFAAAIISGDGERDGYEVFLKMREMLYADTGVEISHPEEIIKDASNESRSILAAWSLLRAGGTVPDLKTRDKVLGVIIEDSNDDGVLALAGYADGQARLFWGAGGGYIGENWPVSLKAAAKKLVAAARTFAVKGVVETAHKLPEKGEVRIIMLTPGGARVLTGSSEDFENERGPMSAVYKAAFELVGEFRKLDEERERNSE